MNAIAIVNMIVSALQTATTAAPIVIKGIEDAKPFALDLWARLTGEAPSAADEARIDELLAALSAQLEQPLPPAQPGDPDYQGP